MVDDIDIKILQYLQKDGRATASKIALKLELTVPTITVVSSSSNNYQEVIRKAVECPEVIQCFSTTGMGSLLLWVSTKNSQSLEELLRKIQSWPNVTRTETQVILSSYKSFFELSI